MVGWYHWLDGHEFKQAPGVGDGQGSLACCSLWGCKELDTTEQLNWIEYHDQITLYKANAKQKSTPKKDDNIHDPRVDTFTTSYVAS